jgi:hypothetical protein
MTPAREVERYFHTEPDYNAPMNWMQLALQLTRAAMNMGDEPQRQPETPADLGEALAQQFALIDRNVEAVARMVNAQNQRLERELKRQRIWNYGLMAGFVIAITVALIRA